MQLYKLLRLWGPWGAKRLWMEVYSKDHRTGTYKACDYLREWSSHMNGNRTHVMEFLGQELLTKVPEEQWGWVRTLFKALCCSGLNKAYKGVHKLANQMSLRHQFGWGVEGCDVTGLVIAFLFLCQKTGTSYMLVFLGSWLPFKFFFFLRFWRFKNCPAVNKSLIMFWIQLQIQFLILKKCSWNRMIEAILMMSQNGLVVIASGRNNLNAF